MKVAVLLNCKFMSSRTAGSSVFIETMSRMRSTLLSTFVVGPLGRPFFCDEEEYASFLQIVVERLGTSFVCPCVRVGTFDGSPQDTLPIDGNSSSSTNMRFALRPHWMVIFQYWRILVFPCHVGWHPSWIGNKHFMDFIIRVWEHVTFSAWMSWTWQVCQLCQPWLMKQSIIEKSWPQASCNFLETSDILSTRSTWLVWKS